MMRMPFINETRRKQKRSRNIEKTKPLALLEEEHHGGCQITANDPDPQGSIHHSI
jgi:hypothetical protein